MENLTQNRFMQALEASWPAAEVVRRDGWHMRRGAGGGNRVSAATALGGGDITVAEAQMRDWGQVPLFQIEPSHSELDDELANRGYKIHEPVVFYAAPASIVAGEADLTAAGYLAKLRLAIMEEIWEQEDMPAPRLAIMDRVSLPNRFLMGRVEDRPCGAAFVVVDGDIAMIHAITVQKSMRRKGVGRMLLQTAARFAAHEGAHWLSLAVTEQNPARALYEGVGMKEGGRYHYRILKEAAA